MEIEREVKSCDTTQQLWRWEWLYKRRIHWWQPRVERPRLEANSLIRLWGKGSRQFSDQRSASRLSMIHNVQYKPVKLALLRQMHGSDWGSFERGKKSDKIWLGSRQRICLVSRRTGSVFTCAASEQGRSTRGCLKWIRGLEVFNCKARYT